MPPRAPGGVDAVRVVIVDDEQLVRAGLACCSGRPVRRGGRRGRRRRRGRVGHRRDQPDVVLMDIRMPRRDGLEATERELARRPGLAVLVLTTFDADDMVLRALRLGARGFLLKDTPPAELVAAVHAAAQGRSTLSPTVLDTVIAAARRRRHRAAGSTAGPGAGGRADGGPSAARPPHRARGRGRDAASPAAARTRRSPPSSTSASRP